MNTRCGDAMCVNEKYNLLQSIFGWSVLENITDGYRWITSGEMRIIPSARHSNAKTIASHSSHRHRMILP